MSHCLFGHVHRVAGFVLPWGRGRARLFGHVRGGGFVMAWDRLRRNC